MLMLSVAGTLLVIVCFTLGLKEHVIWEHCSSQTIAKCEYLVVTFAIHTGCVNWLLMFISAELGSPSVNGTYEGCPY
jgi:hypothetical protein